MKFLPSFILIGLLHLNAYGQEFTLESNEKLFKFLECMTDYKCNYDDSLIFHEELYLYNADLKALLKTNAVLDLNSAFKSLLNNSIKDKFNEVLPDSISRDKIEFNNNGSKLIAHHADPHQERGNFGIAIDSMIVERGKGLEYQLGYKVVQFWYDQYRKDGWENDEGKIRIITDESISKDSRDLDPIKFNIGFYSKVNGSDTIDCIVLRDSVKLHEITEGLQDIFDTGDGGVEDEENIENEKDAKLYGSISAGILAPRYSTDSINDAISADRSVLNDFVVKGGLSLVWDQRESKDSLRIEGSNISLEGKKKKMYGFVGANFAFRRMKENYSWQLNGEGSKPIERIEVFDANGLPVYSRYKMENAQIEIRQYSIEFPVGLGFEIPFTFNKKRKFENLEPKRIFLEAAFYIAPSIDIWNSYRSDLTFDNDVDVFYDAGDIFPETEGEIHIEENGLNLEGGTKTYLERMTLSPTLSIGGKFSLSKYSGHQFAKKSTKILNWSGISLGVEYSIYRGYFSPTLRNSDLSTLPDASEPFHITSNQEGFLSDFSVMIGYTFPLYKN